MVDTADLYKNFARISDVKMQTLTGGGYGLSAGPNRYQHTLQSWAVAGQTDDGTWYRYYFVQVDSMLRTFVGGTFKINEYDITMHLVDESSKILPGTQLIAVTPDTTQGSTSYTTSLNESFSASGGFFGDTPTANLGASVSFGHSVTRTIPDIAIHNRSLSEDGQNASWGLGIAENAFAQADTMEFTTQSLFRVPSGPKDASRNFLSLSFKVAVEDHDNNGSKYFDRTEIALRPLLGDVQLEKFDDRGCWLTFPAIRFWLRSPAIPAS